jgi:hypothetical protein
MSVTPRHVPGAVAIGMDVSVLMDVWSLFLKRAFSIPSLFCVH